MADDPYEAFIESRLAAGESEADVRSRLDDAFAPATDLCQVCRARRATLLCDGLIGYLDGGDGYIKRPSAHPDHRFTCDRRLCSYCASCVSLWHWRKSNADGSTADSGHETTDLCPGCKRRYDHNGDYRRTAPITAEMAQQIRLRWWNESVPLSRPPTA